MNKILVGILAVIVLLVAAVLIGPSFVDWNAQKALITEEARKATGRELTIAGDVSLSIVPTPALSAKQVSLANIQGGSAPAMVELEELEVRIALLPLIQGRLQVESVSRVGPQILLERLPDGRANWAFEQPDHRSAPQPAGGGSAQPAPSGDTSDGVPAGDGGFVVQVDSFAIRQGTLLYRDAVTGREERLEDIDAEIVAESLQGPFTVEGEAVGRGVPLRLELAVGRLQAAGATPLNMSLALTETKANGQFSGSISLHPESVELRGRLKGEGEDLAALVGDLTGERLPPVAANPFTLEAVVSGGDAEAQVTELALALGDTRLEGEARVSLEPTLDVQAKVSASRLDLDQLLAAAAPRGEDGRAPDAASRNADQDEARTADRAEGAPAPQTQTATAGAAEAMVFEIPADLGGSVQIGIEALVFREQIVRQIRLNAAMSEGSVTLNQAMALLPGGSDVSVTGALVNAESGPAFAGRIEAASDNLRGVLDWLGIDVAQVPADRLRKMNFTSRIEATAKQVTLADVDLRLDVSRLAGGVVVALRARPGLGVGLSLDSINLDAYLPAATASAEGAGAPLVTEASEDEPASGEVASGTSGTGDGATRPAPGGLGPLSAFDANLNLRIGNLVMRGQTAKDLRVEGTLKDGVLVFKEASVADLGGSSLAYSGRLSGLEATPALDGTLTMKVADPVRLARLGGIEDPLIARIGPFSMSGNFKGDLNRLGLNTRFAALGGQFGLAGTVSPATAPLSFDLTVDGKHPDLVRLAKAFASDLGLPSGLGALDAKARLAGTPLAIQVSDLNGRFGPVSLSGSLAADLSGPQPKASALDLSARVKHPELAELMTAAGVIANGSGGLGAVDVAARLKDEGQSIQLSELSGTLGPLGLAGSLRADLAGERPVLGDLNVNLRLSHPDLARLAAAAGAPGAVAPGLGGVEVTAQAVGTGQKIDLRNLEGSVGPVDLNGTAGLDLSGPRPRVLADLNTGELPISTLLAGGPSGAGGAAGSGGGQLSPRWSREAIDLSGLRSLDADVKLRSTAMLYDKLRLENAQLEALLTDGLLDLKRLVGTLFGGALQVSGKADARAALDAGFAVTAIDIDSSRMLRQMSGFDRVSGPVSINANLRTRGRSEAELVQALSGQGDIGGEITVRAKVEEAAGAALLNLLGDKVKEVRGIAATSNSLLQAFAGAPSSLSGTFLVDRGVARTTDLQLKGRDAVALTHGTADLPAWLINSRTEVHRQGQSGEPFLTAALSGALDDPNVKIGGTPFQQPSGGDASGSATGSAPSGGAAEEKKEPSSEDLTKDLIKGLFEKLAD